MVHDMNTTPAIGLCIMICDKYPQYALDVIRHNSLVFNKVYLVSNDMPNELKDISNLELIKTEIADKYCKKFIKLDKLSYYQISDFIGYDSVNFIEFATGIKYPKVATFDSDFLVFNKALMYWGLFDKYNKSFCAIEKNVFYPEGNVDFVNCCFVFNTNDRLMNSVAQHCVEAIMNKPDKYTASGPSMLNAIELAGSLRSNFPKYYNVVTLRRPNEYIDVNEYCIGAHLEASIYVKTGLYGSDDMKVSVEGNRVKISDIIIKK